LDNHQIPNWKRNLVLVAKNTFVWLYQLSQQLNQQISRLDQIPIEELLKLKEFGVNGIWLIGIWERSQASKKIKTLYGFHDASASAYSILSYRITEKLGGRKSYLKFRENARSAGIKIGCDMVPNHTGLDSPWLIQHPDWYIEANTNPSDAFIFTSPDLSPDNAIEIRIENGYYDQVGAAEVFLYKECKSNKERFIYHGNDGTSMPWNDTAQLNYLLPEVRDAVRKTIIRIAADFDIIRLDAAMTLTRQHFKRLWFPGDDNQRCIPTRENDRMSDAQFDNLMPEEFWEQVVNDINAHEPDTLLLAEAFWLMEGYFIQQIGMDLVYNSAFMHMMAQEKNSEFRDFLHKMVSLQPDALEHLVNYQTTPDEESAIELFGETEKYFGVCTLLCTLPGLPMFGHGQLEGYREKYGMDYLLPNLQETPNNSLIEKHMQWISPILKYRNLFSSSNNFKMHDMVDQNGNIIEDMIIFTNSHSGKNGLVVFNNSPHPYQGTINMDEIIPSLHKIHLESLRAEDTRMIKTSFNHSSNSIHLDSPPYSSDVFLF